MAVVKWGRFVLVRATRAYLLGSLPQRVPRPESIEGLDDITPLATGSELWNLCARLGESRELREELEHTLSVADEYILKPKQYTPGPWLGSEWVIPA